MPNIPKPKRHPFPIYLCTQYPVFSSYLTPYFILKTDDSCKGTWKSELNMPHSNYDRSSYNWKTDPVRNEKWNISYLWKHLSVPPFHFPSWGATGQGLTEALGHALRDSHNPKPRAWFHQPCWNQHQPKPWGSLTLPPQPHEGNCTDSVTRKYYFFKVSSERLL